MTGSSARPWLGRYPDWLPHDLHPEHDNALQMFAETVKRWPDRPALHYLDETIVWAELDRLSSAFAVGLLSNGLQPGDRVGLYLQSIPAFPIALLGTWKAGGIVVSHNPMLKAKELEYQLRDSGARLIVTLASLYPIVAEARSTTDLRGVVVVPDGDANPSAAVPRGDDVLRFDALLWQDAASLPEPALRPEDPAFLTYTSGTTGPAKGAINTHANVVFNSHVYRTWMALDESDVIMGLAPLFHITGLIGHITAATLTGAPLVLFRRFDAAEALRLIEHWSATFTVASITAFIALLDHPDIEVRDLSSLRKVYSGGAPISPAVADRFQAKTGTYIHNIYGLTETTSPSHGVPFGATAPVDPDSGALSVGVPVCNTIVKIADPESGNELPPGEVGEIVTRGPMVVPGYLNKPEESALAVRDGWLHTGDVGKMDADGWFYVVDRTKDMIIASGYKVWPREVEDLLYQHPAVREACVVGAPDPYRGETVVAFVALRLGAEPVTEGELITFCKERIAAYKYPRRITFVDELPKTASGKLLRRVLRDQLEAEPVPQV